MQRLIFIVSILGLTSGCATVSMFPPEVTLVDLELMDMTMFETAAQITVRIANENPDPMIATGSVIRLYLNDIKIGKALSGDRLEIPRLASATQTLSLTVSNLGLARSIFESVESEEVSYRVEGRLYVETSFGSRRLPFDKSGYLNLSEDP